jgi:hypothetical protein
MAATTMKTKPEKKGRSYGRTTAWLALRSGVMRVRLGCVGSVNVEPHGNEMTMSVQPYSGGDARWVPRRRAHRIDTCACTRQPNRHFYSVTPQSAEDYEPPALTVELHPRNSFLSVNL